MERTKVFSLHAFYNRIFKRYDLVNRIFTFGQDQRWRDITAKRCMKNKPDSVLDLCCGTGDLTIKLHQNAPHGVEIVACDFNESMLSVAIEKCRKGKEKNIDFVQGDAASLPFKNEQFDCLTIGFGFRNLTFDNSGMDKHIAEMNRVLRPGGKLFILESAVPTNMIFRFFYRLYLYFFLVPLGTIISGNLKAYWYLAHSSSDFFSTDEIRAMLLERGFSSMKTQRFFLGATNLLEVTK
jgi:demethylmenaquinone methyltransferase / 2-methoxy-6-polyprenyl-1,4-benzoquinol methylase